MGEALELTLGGWPISRGRRPALRPRLAPGVLWSGESAPPFRRDRENAFSPTVPQVSPTAHLPAPRRGRFTGRVTVELAAGLAGSPLATIGPPGRDGQRISVILPSTFGAMLSPRE
jgi:hypothetical protein